MVKLNSSILLTVSLIVACAFLLAEARVSRPRIPQLQHRNHFQGANNNSSSPIPPYTLLYFNQKLDHFNFEDTTTWSQRYLVTDQYLDPTASNPVIVFYTGNEGSIDLFWNNTGFAFTIASQFNAYVIFAEHRYYGESLPFGTSSFELDNVGYLTVEQVLADYAYLIASIKSASPSLTNSPVITLGGSYGGMLSAWFRMKYPNVVVGALAGSAPIMQFQGSPNSFDPSAFNAIITQDFEQAAAGSSDKVREAFTQILSMGNTTEGLASLQSQFKVCGQLENVDDLVNWIESGFAYEAMGDYPYPANFLTPMPGYPINVSAPLINNGDNVLQGLLDSLQIYYNYTGEAGSCFNMSVFVADSLGLEAWDYQACTELVLEVSSNFVTDFFPASPWNYTSLEEYCQYAWGVTPDASWASTFGYNSLEGVTNIIFSNGMLDPWRGGGVQVSSDPTLPALIVEGGAHHLDLRTPNPLDPESVVEVREKEIAFLQSWISDYYAAMN